MARPGADNHLFDCLVGCGVAASVDGLAFSPNSAAPTDPAGPPKPVKRSEVQRQRQAERAAAGRR